MVRLNLCRADLLSMHDGDTMVVDLYESKGIRNPTKLRLARINAFEMKDLSDRGRKSRDFLFNLVSDETGYKTLLVQLVKNKKFVDQQEKYGRWLAEVWIFGEDPDTTPSLNDRLVDNGHAVYIK